MFSLFSFLLTAFFIVVNIVKKLYIN